MQINYETSLAKICSLLKKSGFILTLIVIGFQGQAQNSEVTPLDSDNMLIVTMESAQSWENLKSDLSPKSGISTHILAKHFNIYGVYSSTHSSTLKNWLELHPGVIHVTRNERAEARFEPNDELYDEQWGHKRVYAAESWDHAKGDTTALGDEIVIAILDDGIDVDHPDLNQQIWLNTDEIMDNQVDDDNNGFTDDYLGWNFFTLDDKHPSGPHGSPVAGIAAATTNNMEGIAGTAYNTKIMALSNALNKATIIMGLEYVYMQRKAYNKTDGKEGAFVVAVNTSFGFDYEFPEDFPEWCSMIDSLGEVGILSVSSVTNFAVDVNEEGDIPTTCPSEYLISVTRTDRADELSENESGYSNIHVDLAAPGQDIQTTNHNATYGTFDGTSASAPFVSGAIATMYSLPCKEFALAFKQNPAAVALAVKETIMNSVNMLPTLEGKSVSGGRLNIEAAVLSAPALCNTPTGPFDIQAIYPNPTNGEFKFEYIIDSYQEIKVELYDLQGQKIHAWSIMPDVFGERIFTFHIGPQLPDGMYLVKIEQATKKKWGKILLKSHN